MMNRSSSAAVAVSSIIPSSAVMDSFLIVVDPIDMTLAVLVPFGFCDKVGSVLNRFSELGTALKVDSDSLNLLL